MVLTPPHSENALITGLLADRGIPFARIGSIAPGPGFALTMGDDRNAFDATRRLIELGHTRIGMIAGPDAYSLSAWRVEGWRQALSEAGLPHEGLCAAGDFGFESGSDAARTLLTQDDPPTAIVASSDQMALATLDVARELGLSVPRDLSVISFDNTPIVRFTDPPLTAVDQPIAETISRAVELIIRSRRDAAPDAVIDVEGSLVERGSTAPAPHLKGVKRA